MSHVEVTSGSYPYLQFARHVTRLSRHALRRLDPPLREQLGISALELSALRCVEAGYENPMRVAERLVLAPSSASRLVDRLADLGLIERADDPGDRRKAQLRVTSRGSEIAESAQGLIADGVQQMFRGLPPTDFDAAVAILAKLIDHVESAVDLPDDGSPEPAAVGDRDHLEASVHV